MRSKPTFFDGAWYVQNYSDVALQGMDPLRHYLRHGRFEGRLPCALAAMSRERDLRFGAITDRESAFQPLLDDPSPAERVWARIALARDAASRSDWRRVESLLSELDPRIDIIRGFGSIDPVLLAIESSVVARKKKKSLELLYAALTHFGVRADLILSMANIICAAQGIGRAWRAALAPIYFRYGIVPPYVQTAIEPCFDDLAPPGGHMARIDSREGPLVSVLIPARNAASTIRTALSSIVVQTWRNIEVIVLDNGSLDNTVDVAASIARTDPRIHIVDAGAEIGAYMARNIGLSLAKGEYITVLDADDWAHPVRIERQLRPLLHHPELQGTVSFWVRTTSNLRFTRWWKDDGYLHPNISSLLFRASVRDTIGYWDRVLASADTEFLERLKSFYGPKSVLDVCPNVPLSFGRVRPDALTQMTATHGRTSYGGARADYASEFRRWHDSCVGRKSDLRLPQHPRRRPFLAPEELGVGDPPPDTDDVARVSMSHLFDVDWYRRTYADVRLSSVHPAAHYLRFGAAEGRDPGPLFSTTGFRLLYPCRDNPLLEHIRSSGKAARPVLPDIAGELPAPEPGRHLLFAGHQARAALFGAERSLIDMLDRAIACGMTPSVVLPALDNAEYLFALQKRSYKIHIRPFGWIFGAVTPHPASVNTIAELIAISGAVVLHQNTSVVDAPAAAARRAGIPVVVHLRELHAENPRLSIDYGVTQTEIRNKILSMAECFVANSDAVARWINVDSERIIVRNNTVDQRFFDMKFLPESPVRVAMIGSLSRAKGIEFFVRLSRAALAEGIQTRFLLIGPSSADLEALRPFPSNLSLVGYCSDAADAMRQADVVVSLPLAAESWGRSVAEALAAGRPVLCNDIGTPPELVGRDGLGGIVVPAGNLDATLSALSKMVKSREHLIEMSVNARIRAASFISTPGGSVDRVIYDPRWCRGFSGEGSRL